jgi:hypothetical protein
LDGTLAPIGRVTAQKPYYSGEHKRHGMNAQVFQKTLAKLRCWPATTTRHPRPRFANQYFAREDGTWFRLGDAIRTGDAQLYRVQPDKAFAFAAGESSQARRQWRLRCVTAPVRVALV